VTNCAAALVETMRGVGPVAKNDYNESQRFSFRGIDAVLNVVGPQLREHGVLVIPEVLEYTHTLRETRHGGTVNHYVVKVCYHFVSPAAPITAGGQVVNPGGNTVQSVTVFGEAMDAGDKGISKAMSVAYRIALLQMFAIPTGDRDPDSDSHELSEQQQSPENPRTVPEIRGKIVRYLQANRTPAWSIDEIAADFYAKIGIDIRQATVESLENYYEAVCK
jgi:hypothetical protein